MPGEFWKHLMPRRKFIFCASSLTLFPLLAQRFPSPKRRPWRFLTTAEAATLDALCETLIPADHDAGASQARRRASLTGNWPDTIARFSRFTARASLHWRRRPMRGSMRLSRRCRPLAGRELVRALESGKLPAALWSPAAQIEFFHQVLEHTMQGFYGSPRHGGNDQAVSWRMLGLPEPPLRSRRPATRFVGGAGPAGGRIRAPMKDQPVKRRDHRLGSGGRNCGAGTGGSRLECGRVGARTVAKPV